MKKQEKCLPLTLLQSISNKYPGCWNSIEEVRKNINWPTWCYIPTTYCRRIVMMAMLEKGENPNDAKAIVAGVLDGELMGALASWRGSKEIYRFDPELEKELYKGANDTIDQKMPAAAFENLPFPCIWIETSNLVIANSQIKGFFVWREYLIGLKGAELRMIFVTKDMALLPISLDYKDRDRAMKDLLFKNLTSGKEMAKSLGKEDFSLYKRAVNQAPGEIAQALQLVLYLCSVGADVEENPVQKKITRRSSVLHDKYREVRKWDVGVRYGNAIRAYAAKEGKSHKGSHSRKRPHWRKGHFQHYWTGPKSKPEERQLVLTWIQPVLVNENLLEDGELPAVVHKVE